MDQQEHFARLATLLKKERAEDRQQYEQKIRNRSLQNRRADGVCWFPFLINRSYLGTGERWVIEGARTQDLHQRHMFQVGASVSVFLAEEKVTRSINGVVSRLVNNEMRIVLNAEGPPDWLEEGKLGVDLLFDESTYVEMEKALANLQKLKAGRTKELVSILLGKKAPEFSSKKAMGFAGLNESQQLAISRIVAAKDLALVHGPPGTGKTTTIVSAISAVLEQEDQVLVCAASNAAVDLLVERLHHEDVKVLRLGHPGRVDEEVLSHTLDVQLSQHQDSKMLRDLRRRSTELRGIGLKYKRKFGKEEREQRRMLLDEAKKLKEDAILLEEHMIYQLLQEAQVIACTLIGASSDYLRSKRFTTLFIDEASQALEPASWVPILKADSVIMAGDHKQLPPTIKSEEAAREGLSETLFSRAMTHFDEVATVLDVQYRMHPDIAAFSNKHFYGGVLTDAVSVTNRRQPFSPPVLFIDTAGCGFSEEVNPETLSTFNSEQASFTLKFFDGWLADNPVASKSSVGIIAPYKAHLEILRKEIVHYPWYAEMADQISINSVDAFQGQERDIVLLDLVRSNDKGVVGFLSDTRRTNVALTRAKHQLVIIGDSATLSTSEFYDEMIRFFQDRNVYHSAFEYLY